MSQRRRQKKPKLQLRILKVIKHALFSQHAAICIILNCLLRIHLKIRQCVAWIHKRLLQAKCYQLIHELEDAIRLRRIITLRISWSSAGATHNCTSSWTLAGTTRISLAWTGIAASSLTRATWISSPLNRTRRKSSSSLTRRTRPSHLTWRTRRLTGRTNHHLTRRARWWCPLTRRTRWWSPGALARTRRWAAHGTGWWRWAADRTTTGRLTNVAGTRRTSSTLLNVAAGGRHRGQRCRVRVASGRSVAIVGHSYGWVAVAVVPATVTVWLLALAVGTSTRLRLPFICVRLLLLLTGWCWWRNEAFRLHKNNNASMAVI